VLTYPQYLWEGKRLSIIINLLKIEFMNKTGRFFGVFVLITFLIIALAVMFPLLLIVDVIDLLTRLFKKKGKDEYTETD